MTDSIVYLADLSKFKAVPDPDNPGFFRINSVPIVNLGLKHGRVNVNEGMAQKFIKNFLEEKAEDGDIPSIWFGHNVESRERPAKGAIDNLSLLDRVNKAGQKIKTVFADLVRMTADTVKKLAAGEFPKRSIEFNPRVGKLAGLALLSRQPHDKMEPLVPQVAPMLLDDGTELEMEALEFQDEESQYAPDQGKGKDPRKGKGSNMSEFEKLYEMEQEKSSKLQADLDELNVKLEEATVKADTLTKENAELKDGNEKLQADLEKKAQETHTTNVRIFLTEQKAVGRVSPAEEEDLTKLASTEEGFKTVQSLVEKRKEYSMIPLEELVENRRSEESAQDGGRKTLSEADAFELGNKVAKEESISLSDAMEKVRRDHDVKWEGSVSMDHSF